MDKKLLKKFIQGKSTCEESQVVIAWFNEHGEAKFLKLIEEDWYSWESDIGEHSDQLRNALQKIHAKISEKELNLVHKEKQISSAPTPYKSPDYTKYAVAAVISLLLVAAITYYIARLPDPSKDETGVALKAKQVPFGQKATIYLGDGTKVMLNAGSYITFPEKFPSHSREVFLEGEAFFEVVKDEQRPFSVVSGDVTTVALGTSFNVKAYCNVDEVEVALVTGKVAVSDRHYKTAPVALAPGELLILNTSNGASRKEHFTAKEKLGWTNHLLYFNDAEASEVFTTLERWYGVEFIFNKAVKKRWRYSGEFKNKSLEIVLEGISYVKAFEFSFKEGKQVEIHFK